MLPRAAVPALGSEETLSLLVDHLLRFLDGKALGVVRRGMGVGANELVRAQAVARILLDEGGCEELAAMGPRGRDDPKALVFDGRTAIDNRRRGIALPTAEEPLQNSAQDHVRFTLADRSCTMTIDRAKGQGAENGMPKIDRGE
jgi:hypothetical protein